MSAMRREGFLEGNPAVYVDAPAPVQIDPTEMGTAAGPGTVSQRFQ
jgi:hypothetical protein